MTLDLQAPDYDLAVTNVMVPEGGLAVFSHIDVMAKVENVGRYTSGPFTANCTVFAGGQVIYETNTQVEPIAVSNISLIRFQPFQVLQTGELEFHVSISSMVSDYNDYNNFSSIRSSVSNIVDDFEMDRGYWTVENGWGISDLLNGHSGSHSAHVNNGVFPYLNGMNTTMTFMPGFDLHAIDNAVLKFHTRFVTEPDKDICYVEVSGDSIHWNVMDSFSGMNLAWIQREINLKDYIKPYFPRVWVRFRFVSDDANTSIGVLIDDVAIYPQEATTIPGDQVTQIPSAIQLFQNYPNPFNPVTHIHYRLLQPSRVRIEIYDLLGNCVSTLIDADQEAGNHFVSWRGTDETGNPVSSGLYLCSLTVGDFKLVNKMMLIR